MKPLCLTSMFVGRPERRFLLIRPEGAAKNKNNQAKGVRWAKDYVLGDKVKVAAAAG